MTYTPGPWSVQENGDGSVSIAGACSPDPITNARYLWVADVLRTQSSNPLWRQEEESEANARLIAAAPSLLEAAQDVIFDLELLVSRQGPGPDRRLEALKKAIRKATNEEGSA